MDLRNHIAVDRYVLLRRLASGGMANVFLARRSAPGRFCRLLVLKCIHPHLARKPEFREAFLEEARLGGLIRHPNVVAVYDLVEQDGLPCMVQEFVHGRVVSALAQESVRRNRPLSDALAVDLTVQCLRGLGHVHRLTDPLSGEPLGVVHRDVSPQNILVGVDGRVRVFDFGIAQAVAAGGRPHGGALAGKYPYLSPEQCRGQAVDARSDLFSLGIILYELLTRTRLFKRDSPIATLNAVLEEPIPPPRSRRPEVPEALEEIVLRALERDPADRYASAHDMMAALVAWLHRCEDPWGSEAMQKHLVHVLGPALRAELAEFTALSSLPEPHPVPEALLQELEALAPPAATDDAPWGSEGEVAVAAAGEARSAGEPNAVPSVAPRRALAPAASRAATLPVDSPSAAPTGRPAIGLPTEEPARSASSPSLSLLRERRGARRRGLGRSPTPAQRRGSRGRPDDAPEHVNSAPWWVSLLGAGSVALLIVLLARLLLLALPLTAP